MLPVRVRIVVVVVAILGWSVLAVSACPLIPWVASDELSRLALPAAGVGTLVYALHHRAMPITEVLAAGRAIGYAQAKAEGGSDRVAPLDRRHLRVVDDA